LSEDLIKIENLTKTYSRGQSPAISAVDFNVNDGELVGFVGLNGAGKTTTIKVAVGVLLPTSGKVIVDGQDIVTRKTEASRRLGWVPEIPNFDQNARAVALFKYYAGFYGIDGTEAERRALDLLKQVGLEGFEKRKVGTYSQGMKKRFSLGVSLLSDPQNFLFDEVLNGLDPEGIRYFRELMVELKKRGKAVLLSSHILSEVENLADRVVFIHKGKIIKVATREDLASFGEAMLKVVIQNINQSAIDYLQSLGEVSVDGKTVILSGYKVDPAQINSELSRRGFAVSEFSAQHAGLEQYFIKLIGETK
jgi:ABC-2 type transport system ATP-binding protein